MKSRYFQSAFHSRQSYLLSRGLRSEDKLHARSIVENADNQDRMLAEMISLQAESLRAQRSRYLPHVLPTCPVVIVQ